MILQIITITVVHLVSVGGCDVAAVSCDRLTASFLRWKHNIDLLFRFWQVSAFTTISLYTMLSHYFRLFIYQPELKH